MQLQDPLGLLLRFFIVWDLFHCRHDAPRKRTEFCGTPDRYPARMDVLVL